MLEPQQMVIDWSLLGVCAGCRVVRVVLLLLRFVVEAVEHIGDDGVGGVDLEFAA